MTVVAETEAPPRDLAAVGAALVTVVLWASAFVGIRSAGTTFGPGALSLARLVVATVALGTVMIVRGERLPRRADLRIVGAPLSRAAPSRSPASSARSASSGSG